MAEDLATVFAAGVQARINGRYDEAEACFKSVLRVEPSNADAHHELGLVYSYLVHDDCISELEAAVRLQPESVPYLVTLAKTKTMFGEYGEAKDLFQRVLLIDPFNEEANKNLEFLNMV